MSEQRLPSIQYDNKYPDVIGVRVDISAKDDIYYILLYDIDKPTITTEELAYIDHIFWLNHVSYLVYKTKHGFHVVGLTALTFEQWSSMFIAFKRYFKSRYGGIVLRLSRKKDEVQELVRFEEYGDTIPNLYNLYCSRFNMQKRHWIRETSKYLLVFDHYRTTKI